MEIGKLRSTLGTDIRWKVFMYKSCRGMVDETDEIREGIIIF